LRRRCSARHPTGAAAHADAVERRLGGALQGQVERQRGGMVAAARRRQARQHAGHAVGMPGVQAQQRGQARIARRLAGAAGSTARAGAVQPA
jgi:hypothetical protein